MKIEVHRISFRTRHLRMRLLKGSLPIGSAELERHFPACSFYFGALPLLHG